MLSKFLAQALLWAMYRTGRSCDELLSEWRKEKDIGDLERLKVEREKTLAERTSGGEI